MYYPIPDKAILTLNERLFVKALQVGKDNLNIVWVYNSYDTRDYTFYPTSKDIQKELSNNIETKVEDKAKLYFTKKSKIPRFKLQETEYKRVIKADKADYIIVNEIPNIIMTKDTYIFENECALFFVDYKYIEDYAHGNVSKFLEILETINNRSNFKETPIYSGTLNRVPNKDNYIFDIYDKAPNKKIILDKIINRILDKSFSTMTENDLTTIYSMLSSTDKSSVEMGLKLLTNFNIAETPYLIYSIIYETKDNWKFNDAKNSVSVKNLFDSIGFKEFYVRNSIDTYHQIYHLMKEKFKKEPTEEEIQLIKKYFTNKKKDILINRLNDSIIIHNNPLHPKIIISYE